ncbi:hypothetical protein VTI74DRAFT_5225 [Chaetomium olivicolor]
MPLGHLIKIVINKYVPESDAVRASSSIEPSPRICGSWAEVLPELVGSETKSALASAIRAFALTILSRGPERSVPITAGLEAYQRALITVNDALQAPYSAFPAKLGAAVMCLLLVELYHLTPVCSWTAHLQGLAELMQLSQPEFYASGIPHRLFVGARPALVGSPGSRVCRSREFRANLSSSQVVLAFFSRRSSFLAKEEWRTVPFRESSPSPVQALMSEAAAIPAILEKLDSEGVDAVAEEALHEFDAVLDRLNAWGDGFQSSASPSPLFWFQPSSGTERPHIWFQNITMANVLTHLWAFKIMCLRNIHQLRLVISKLDSKSSHATTNSDEAKRLSTMICQSTEYLMQEKMKLFGPTSVTLPLRTAYAAFEAGGVETKEELEWCRDIVDDLRNRGYGFMSVLIGA